MDSTNLCFLECEIILKMMTILAGAGHCHYGQFATIPPQQDGKTFLSFFDKIKILKWFETTINHHIAHGPWSDLICLFSCNFSNPGIHVFFIFTFLIQINRDDKCSLS